MEVGDIMIYYPEVYGTCRGSNTAIEMALKLKENILIKMYIYIKKYCITHI